MGFRSRRSSRPVERWEDLGAARECQSPGANASIYASLSLVLDHPGQGYIYRWYCWVLIRPLVNLWHLSLLIVRTTCLCVSRVSRFKGAVGLPLQGVPPILTQPRRQALIMRGSDASIAIQRHLFVALRVPQRLIYRPLIHVLHLSKVVSLCRSSLGCESAVRQRAKVLRGCNDQYSSCLPALLDRAECSTPRNASESD